MFTIKAPPLHSSSHPRFLRILMLLLLPTTYNYYFYYQALLLLLLPQLIILHTITLTAMADAATTTARVVALSCYSAVME